MLFALTAAWLQPMYTIKADARVDGSNRTLASSYTSFAIQPDGNLWGWGANNNGQLGDGTSTDRHIPIHIKDDVIAIESNRSNTLAITSDNTLWIWGSHSYQQPLEEGIIDRYVPSRLLDDVVSVASSNNSVMVIRTDGSLWSAGSNLNGQLGTNEDNFSRQYFEKVMDDAVAVTMGRNHVLVIKNDGSLWAWGSNVAGQLGDGTNINRYEPVHILDDVVHISACDSFSTAITTSNYLYAWGRGISLQTLTGDSDVPRNSPSPMHIFTIEEEDIPFISVGGNGSFLLTTDPDGSLLGIGSNNRGQLGDGTGRPGGAEIKDNVLDFVAGSDRTVLAITEDGSLWAWGQNDRGTVGDNSTTDRPMPVRIMDGFMSPGPPQILAELSDNEGNGNTNDLIHEDPDGESLHTERPGQGYDNNNESEGLNLESVLLVAGIAFIAILSIAILIVFYLIIKQRR